MKKPDEYIGTKNAISCLGVHSSPSIGKDIRVISDIFTPRDIVKAISDVVGKEVVLKEIDRAAFDANKEEDYELWAK